MLHTFNLVSNYATCKQLKENKTKLEKTVISAPVS